MDLDITPVERGPKSKVKEEDLELDITPVEDQPAPQPTPWSAATGAISEHAKAVLEVPETPIGQFIANGLMSEEAAGDFVERVARNNPNSAIKQFGASVVGTLGQIVAPADVVFGAASLQSGLRKGISKAIGELTSLEKGIAFAPDGAGEVTKLATGAKEAISESAQMAARRVSASEQLPEELDRIKRMVDNAKAQRVRPESIMTTSERDLYTKYGDVIEASRAFRGAKPASMLGRVERAEAAKAADPLAFKAKEVKSFDDYLDNLVEEESRNVLVETGLAGDKQAVSNLKKSGVKISSPEAPPPAPSLWSKFSAPKAFDDAMNNWVRSVDTGLRRQGKYGEWMANGLRKVRDVSEMKTAETMFEISPSLKSLSKSETEQLVDALDKGAEITSPKVQSAYDIIKRKFNEVADSAQEVGLTIRTKMIKPSGKAGVPSESWVETNPWRPRENFYPHIHNLAEMVSSDNYANRLVAHLISTKQAKNRVQALSALNQYLRKNMQRRVGNLEYSRTLDLPDFDRNPMTALSKYFKGAYHRLEEAKTFGANDEKVKVALTNILGEKGQAAHTYADEAFSRAVKITKDEITGRQAMGFLRNLTTWTKMGLSGITNAPQGVQSMVVTDMNAFAKGVKATLSAGGKDFAARSGVVLESTLDDLMRQGAGGSLSGEKYLRAVGFTATERFNRTLAANVGREFVLDLFAAAKKSPGNPRYKREFLKLGLDPAKILKKDALSMEDQVIAARNVVERTQFLTDPQDLPLFWSSSWGRFAFQLKTFAYKQAQFVTRELLSEAARGNFRPLTRYLAAGALTGEAVADIKAFIKGKDRDKRGFERVVENLATVGGIGIMQDIYYNLSGTQPKLGMLVAPAAAAPVGDFVGAVMDVAKGEPKKAAKRIAPNVPFVGPVLKGMMDQKKNRREYGR